MEEENDLFHQNFGSVNQFFDPAKPAVTKNLTQRDTEILVW